jgi:hypothetical protein
MPQTAIALGRSNAQQSGQCEGRKSQACISFLVTLYKMIVEGLSMPAALKRKAQADPCAKALAEKRSPFRNP